MTDPAEMLGFREQRWACHKFSVTFDFAGKCEALTQETYKRRKEGCRRKAWVDL